MRFNLFLPAVALAVTTSSTAPVLAYAASPPPATPHSTFSTHVRTAKTRAQVTNVGVRPSSESKQGSTGTVASGGKRRKCRQGVHTLRSSIRLAVTDLFNALNSVRTAKGLPVLSLDPQESKCSRLHSQHMALNGRISHDQFPTDVCVPHHFAAENVGFDPGPPPNAVMVLHNLMMHEGPCAPAECTGATYEQHAHYLNILNPMYRHVGIGIVVKRGATWLTEDFTA